MKARKSTYSLYFYINKKREDKDKKCPIYLRITVNGTQTATSIKRSIESKMWDKKGFPKGKSPDVKELENYMDAIRSKINSIQVDLMLKETCITAEMFRSALFGTNTTQATTLINLFNECAKKEEALFKKKEKSDNAYKEFTYTAMYIEDFLKKKYSLSDIGIRKVDRLFVDRFTDYLIIDCNKGHSYSIRCLRRFRTILDKAIQYDIITKNPFYGIELKDKHVEGRKYLADVDLEKFIRYQPKDKAEEIEHDIFRFCVFTGLSSCDAERLTIEHLYKADNGWRIQISRGKTKVMSIIPLLPQAEAILNKYNDDSFENALFGRKLLPVKTVQCRNIHWS